MDFYTSIFQRGDKLFVRGYKDGVREKKAVPYKPYLFIPAKAGKYRTLDDAPVDKIDFDSISEAKEFIKKYEDVANLNVYGLTNYPYTYIFDNFRGEIDYNPENIKITTIDIECAADEGFPDIEKADKEITAITLRSNGKSYVFGCGDFYTDDKNIFYVKCRDEYQLLSKFIDAWEHLDSDIITGWNIEFFDIPYLVNRIKNQLGLDFARRLSPWNLLIERNIEFRGKQNQSYDILGVAVLDYYQLYRKFTFGNQESYKLDYIAQVELDERKIDYSEYGNLLELYKNNFQKFIEYNIYDCVLVDRLDEKLNFLAQVMAFAYDAKVNYEDTMSTVRPWDVIIHNYLLEQNIVIPQFKKQDNDKPLVGGYVKEPRPAEYDWAVSFDLNSLYPHLIMQYNISPETARGRIEGFPGIDYLLTGKYNFKDYLDDDSYTAAANGCQYDQSTQGFLPALMEKMYNDRVVYKKKMIEAKKRYEETKDPKEKFLISRYHNMQQAKKIQLNSAYGALGNAYYRWFDHSLAESITMSGQLSIRWIGDHMNAYMNKLLKTNNEDYIIASDTDSIYIEMKNLVDKVFEGGTDKTKIVDALDGFIQQKVEPYIEECYQNLAKYMNAKNQKMKMKRETIAEKAIWRKKKMYIMAAWDVEGVRYTKPSIKISGVEAVRSSTPHICREALERSYEIFLLGSQDDLIKHVKDFKTDFDNRPFDDIAFPRGVKGLKKYSDSVKLYKSGTPIQVKAALIHNQMIKQKDLKNIAPISDGDKIKFAYLKMPNPAYDTVIASADNLPKEFGLDKYIDKDLQFAKTFLDPVKSFAEIKGWEVEHVSTLDDFFA